MKENATAPTYANRRESSSPQQVDTTTQPQFLDLRTESVVQQRHRHLLQQSPQSMQLRANTDLANAHTDRMIRKNLPVQSANTPVQRKLVLSDKGEEFTDVMTFLNVYGVGKASKGVTAKFNEIRLLIESGEHTHSNIEALLSSLGYEEESDEVTFKVSMVIETLGNPGIELDTGSVFKGVKSSKQSSHPLYEVIIDNKKMMLKKEPDGKSEFGGMKEMASQGITTPAAVWLMVEGLGECLLMQYIETLGPGLGTMNKNDKNTMAGPARSLGIMHVTDIKIGNADRLPWRGNGYSGHLNNVFTDLLSGAIIGLDSEQNMDIGGELLQAIKDELHEIESDANAYAEKIYALLKKDGNKDKLILEDEVAQVFLENFAVGLSSALPENIDALGAVEDDQDDDLLNI